MSRPSQSSWWGGLYKRLLARGFDPATAKFVARHVRDDAKPFIQRCLDDPSRDTVVREFLGPTRAHA